MPGVTLRVNTLKIHLDASIDFFHRKYLKRFGGRRARASFQTELVPVQWTNHLPAPEQTLGKRALSMRATVAGSEYLSITLPEYCDRFSTDNIATSLPQRNCGDISQVHSGCHYFFSHYFLQPPMRKLIRVH